MLVPERLRVADGDFALVDFDAVPGGGDLHGLFCAVFVFPLFGLRLLMDALCDDIVIAQIFRVDGLIFLRGARLGEVDLHRHEGAVFLQYFAHTVFIRELQAVFGKVQDDLGTDPGAVGVVHRVLGGAVAGPVYRFGAFLPGEGVDLDLVGDHKDRVEAESEMADDLIAGRFVLVFLKESLGAREGDLGNVFLDLPGGHADTVIGEGERLVLGIHDHVDAVLVTLGEGVFADNIQLVEFGDGVAAV